MITGCLETVRAAHFAGCMLFFGIFMFDLFAGRFAGPAWGGRRRAFEIVLLPILLLTGTLWFAGVAVSISGLAGWQAFDNTVLSAVWNQTAFGTVWKVRLIFLGAAVLAVFLPDAPARRRLQWFLAALLLGSLAWAGHGRETSNWHLGADVLHLLVAGVWPAGLLPLWLVMRRMASDSEPATRALAVQLVRRFSAVSMAAVALLSFTGWINARYLVGSWSNLFQQPYGRWLCAKILLFLAAVALGAINWWVLKPRLRTEQNVPPAFAVTARQLQFNIRLELLLNAAVTIIVAILGLLPPAAN